MPFIIDGVEQNIRGTLTSVCVDNPASNMFGEFINLSSAFRKCRHCLATEEDIQKVVCVQCMCIKEVCKFKVAITDFVIQF